MRFGSRSVTPVLLLSILAAALAVLVIVLVALRLFTDPPRAGLSASSIAQAKDNASAKKLAEELTAAFLDIDYRDMDPRITRVLDLSTGTFHDAYEGYSVTMKAAAQQGRTISTGAVKQVGLVSATPTQAQALVMADNTVANKFLEAARKKGQVVDDLRQMRLLLTLVKVDGSWRVNDMQFVG